MYMDDEKCFEASSNNIENGSCKTEPYGCDDKIGPYVDDEGARYNCPVNIDGLSSGKRSQWGKKKLGSEKVEKKSQWGKTKVGLDKRSYYKYRNNIF